MSSRGMQEAGNEVGVVRMARLLQRDVRSARGQDGGGQSTLAKKRIIL